MNVLTFDSSWIGVKWKVSRPCASHYVVWGTPPLHLTNIYEVKRKILSLKLRSATGNDGITPLMLRHLSRKTLTHLTYLFNHLLRLGHFPTCWKRAKVVPIPKANKPGNDPNSYRPISLLSTLGKLFERIVAARLTSFVNRQHLLPHTQFGLRKKHSTVFQLVRITDYISNGYNFHRHSGIVLLDLEKAYDTVWIHGLLYKLITFKLPTYILLTLKAFLEGRSFTVHLNDTSLSPKTSPSGLPQGAVLSTTLFAIYISDMPHPPNTQLALYTDDTAILTQSWRTDTIVHRLTHATSVLFRYFTRWKLQVNIHKTGHFVHSTPSCSPNTSPLPADSNPVELTNPLSSSPTRPQTPVYEAFNLSNS